MGNNIWEVKRPTFFWKPWFTRAVDMLPYNKRVYEKVDFRCL